MVNYRAVLENRYLSDAMSSVSAGASSLPVLRLAPVCTYLSTRLPILSTEISSRERVSVSEKRDYGIKCLPRGRMPGDLLPANGK